MTRMRSKQLQSVEVHQSHDTRWCQVVLVLQTLVFPFGVGPESSIMWLVACRLLIVFAGTEHAETPWQSEHGTSKVNIDED